MGRYPSPSPCLSDAAHLRRWAHGAHGATISDGATVAASVAGGGRWRGMGSTHGGGESSVSVNHPASEASKDSAERRKRGEAERERERRGGCDRAKGRTTGDRTRHNRGRGRKDIAIIIK